MLIFLEQDATHLMLSTKQSNTFGANDSMLSQRANQSADLRVHHQCTVFGLSILASIWLPPSPGTIKKKSETNHNYKLSLLLTFIFYKEV